MPHGPFSFDPSPGSRSPLRWRCARTVFNQPQEEANMLQVLFDNIAHNLFKPLLLFFYAGFLIPILGIGFEFPQVIYQGLTIYLLLSIGWRGGEELAGLPAEMLNQAAGFMVLGFITNLLVGIATYYVLRWATRLRKVDAAAVAGHYGSDSAGTFV